MVKMRNKHAYLIMAYNHFEYLKLLISKIDADFNDIYIHIDKKSKCDTNELRYAAKKSHIFFVNRIRVNWGGFSQIRCEYLLLKDAFNNRKYSYYHLISGSDILLKSPEEIYRYFESNGNYEYIHFSESEWSRKVIDRIDYFHFFQECGKRKKLKFINKLERISLTAQMKLGIHRVKNIDQIYGGSNWFSITSEAVQIVLSEWHRWKKTFRYCYCGDELFLQTIIMNSSRKEFISEKGNLRKIDWTRGSPYIWVEGDLNELINSDCLFARKINYDDELYNKIFSKITLASDISE